MPRIFIALRQGEKKEGVPKRLVTGGLANVKTEMKKYPDTKWLVALYNFKPSVDNICVLLKDIASKKARKLITENHEFEVSAAGRLRKVE